MQLHLACPQCGFPVPTGIAGVDTTNVRISNARFRCPRCRTLVEAPLGRFDFIGNSLVLFTKAAKEDLRAFQVAAEAAARQAPEAEEAKRTLARRNPLLAKVLDVAVRWGIPSLVLTLAQCAQAEWHEAGDAQQDAAILERFDRLIASNEQLRSDLRRAQAIPANDAPPPSVTAPSANRAQRRKADSVGRSNSRRVAPRTPREP